MSYVARCDKCNVLGLAAGDDHACHRCGTKLTRLDDTLAALRARCERYRQALERIADNMEDYPGDAARIALEESNER